MGRGGLMTAGLILLIAAVLVGGAAIAQAPAGAPSPAPWDCGPDGSYHHSCYASNAQLTVDAVKAAKQACFDSWPKPSKCTVTLYEARQNLNGCPIGIIYYFPNKTCRTNYQNYQDSCPQYNALNLGDDANESSLDNKNYKCEAGTK